MKWQWRLATLKNGLQDATAYRLEFIIQVLSSAMVPAAIQWVFWYAMFILGGNTEVAGMSYAQMVHYTLASILFTQIRGGDNDFELAEMIREGQLSNYLLRPVGSSSSSTYAAFRRNFSWRAFVSSWAWPWVGASASRPNVSRAQCSSP